MRNGCYEIELVPKAARTAAYTGNDLNSAGCRGLLIAIIASSPGAAPSVTFTVQGKIGDQYYTLLASAAITGAGTTILRISPDLTAAANTIAKDMIPNSFRINAAVGNTDTLTYQVLATLIP